MSFDADWSLDFCLSCDKQCSDGPYCSQSCRLADLRHSGSPSTDTSPTSSANSSPRGFFLPPAIDFSAYRRPTSSITQSPSVTTKSYPTTTQVQVEQPSTPPMQRTSDSTDFSDTMFQDFYSSPGKSLPRLNTHTMTPSDPSNDFQLSDETRRALRQYESYFRVRRSPTFPFQ